MLYLQNHSVDRGLFLLRSTVIIFMLANQLLLSSLFAFSHNGIGKSDVAHELNSYLSPKKSLLSQVSQPIFFVHGVNENASDMGKSEFVPLYSALEKAFGPNSVQTFYYVDDRVYANSCPPKYAPCISQSSILDNAIKLAGQISDLYKKMQQKVTLIGYSMGAAIIRTALAGCQQNVTCQTPLGANIAAMVNNVFFITGVQQGSWLAQKNNGPVTAAVATLRPIANPLLKLLLGSPLPEINSNAVKDFAPQSINIVSHNSVLPPNGIHYFNFYGDIRFSLTIGLLIGQINVKQIDIGDGIILPGTDNPQDTPFWGGARLCFQCNEQNFSQINANTSYMEWPLTTEKSINLADLLTCQTCLLTNLFDIVTHLPQFHTNIPHAGSLDGTDIQVADSTGLSGQPTTSIANEIVLQLQAQHNVFVSSRNGYVYALAAGIGKIRWKYFFGSQIISPLQVVEDEVYFILDGDINTNPNSTSTMYVLNVHDGTVINHFNLPYFTLETGAYIPAFRVVNGNIYFSSPEMAFAKNSKDGSFLWKYSWFGRGASDPVVVNDVVYYVTGTAVIYAFRSTDGTVLWKYDLGPDATPPGSIVGTYPVPVVLQNTLYVVGWLTDNLYAFNVSTHTLLWHTHVTNVEMDGLRVANQVLYVVSYSGSSAVAAVSANTGTEIWSKQNLQLRLATSDGLYCIGVDANGSTTGDLYALSPSNGTTIWHIQMGNGYIGTIATAQMLVYVTNGNTLYALDSTNGNVIWQSSLSDYLSDLVTG